MKVLEELARGCAATSFVAGGYMGVGWTACQFSDQAQEEFFADGPPLAGLTINAEGGVAIPTSDGYSLSGRWPFCTGHHHADWMMMSAVVMDGSTSPEVGIFAAPRGEFQSLGDWKVTGMMGTGSDTLTVQEARIPRHRALLFKDLVAGDSPSTLVKQDPYFQRPLLPFAASLLAAAPLGLAQEALDLFAQRIHTRGITYTPYLKQADSTVTHLQMAEARMKLDEARFHVDRLAQTVESFDAEGTTVMRARCLADVARDVALCREVVEIVQTACGARAIAVSDPLQRIVRDIQAYSLHSLLLATTQAENYGRVLCGLEPTVPF
jgi:alkylation response protein AidB-like acyl-CoA dehydrogenase